MYKIGLDLTLLSLNMYNYKATKCSLAFKQKCKMQQVQDVQYVQYEQDNIQTNMLWTRFTGWVLY